MPTTPSSPARRPSPRPKATDPVLCALALLLGATVLQAQAPTDRMPIQIAIDPGWTVQGGRVTVDGSTLLDGQRKTATLQISRPDGSSETRRAEVSTATGEFQLVLERLLVAGTWEVTAIAPDGKGRASGQFRVLTYREALEEMAGDFEDTLDEADTAVKKTKAIVAALPPSPTKLAAEEKLVALESALASRARDAASLRSVLDAAAELVRQHPAAAPLFAPLGERLGEWSRDALARGAELEQQLAESERRGAVCESIHAASEGIKIATAWLNLAGSAIEIARAFFLDYVGDRFQTNLPEPLRSSQTFSFGIGELIKTGPPLLLGLHQRYGGGGGEAKDRLEGSGQAAGALIGLCYDLVGLLVDRLFDGYCEKLEGPFDAKLHVEFFNASGVVWWRYDIHVEGRLKLRYARSVPAAGGASPALRVHGEFVGSGTEFTLWEDVLRTLDPALMAGNVLFKKVMPVEGFPFVGAEGDYLGSLGPRAFLVPVEGDLVGDRLTLSVLPAKTDFDGVNGWGYYAISGLRTMGFVVFLEVPFPYKGAHFVLTRAADARDQPFTLPVRVDRKTEQVIAERSFSRPRVEGDGNVASYAMKIRICSSGC
jgi:hypothetical protein